MINIEQYQQLIAQLSPYRAQLAAVTKTRPIADVQSLYDLGQRLFAENRALELSDKQPQLPADIIWHFIGHLQRNKLKHLIPCVQLIHSIDRPDLLHTLDYAARQQGRVIEVLLQVHIAQEKSKQGFSDDTLFAFFHQTDISKYTSVRIVGLMGMASLSNDRQQIKGEFRHLRRLFERVQREYLPGNNDATAFRILSMGMSGDYALALDEGATLVRIGSLLFH